LLATNWQTLKRTVFFIYAIWFVSINSLLAEGLSISIPATPIKDIEAGSTVTTMAIFQNADDSECTIELKLNNKEKDWRFLSDYSNIKIPSKSTQRKIIGIHIPNSQIAGEVPITIEALDKKSGRLVDSVVIVYRIKPRYSVELEKIKAPEILFSGDTSSVVFMLRNTSNVDVTVLLKINDESIIKTEEIFLKKESSRLMKHQIKILKSVESYGKRSIFFNAEIKDMPEKRSNFYCGIDYFSLEKENVDRYIRFPIRVSAVGAYTSAYGKGIYSGMYDVSGTGAIGKLKNRQRIEFRMRGPNRNGNPLFGLNDEYFARYSSNSLTLTAGDYRFGLSNLTESSRNGRGLALSYKINKFTFGGYYNIPRYFPLIKQVYSGFSTFEWRNSNSIMVGFLTKTDTLNSQKQMVSLVAKNRIFPWLKTDMEVSLGKVDGHLSKSYHTAATVSTKVLGTGVDYTYADVDFPGFVSNTERLYSYISLNIKSFNISANYHRNLTNQALDTLFAKPPMTEGLSLSSGLRFFNHYTFSLGGVASSTKENSPNPIYNYQRYNGRASLRAQYKHFNFNFDGDYGKLRNNLQNEGKDLTNFFTGNLSSGIFFSDFISTNSFISYQQGQKGITGGEIFYYGISLIFNIKEKINLSLQYNSNFEWTYYASDRSLLSLYLSANINQNNSFSFSTNYNLVKNSMDQKAFNAQLSYTHTIRMPVAKRKDVGNLEGRIINNGVEKVSGVRVSLAGRVAITDKDGGFTFNTVPVGTHILGVDPASFGLHTIAENPGPYSIEILPSKTSTIELSMTKSARVEGLLVVEEDERINQKGYIPVKDRIERLVVEASSDKEVFRVLTDINGFFRFEDLRPGEWKVKVYPNGLPKGYDLLTPIFNLTLLPGGDEKLEVKVQKKARQIQFQQSVKKK